MYTGKATQDAKVWNSVGGQQINTVKTGVSIKADKETVVGGIKYLHLVAPCSGWSKAQWFLYSIEPTPPPEPTLILKHVIKIYHDGSYQVDDGPIVP